MENKQVKITRVLPVSIEKVWKAWTDPKALMQWKAPEGMRTPEAEVDLRVGGVYMVKMVGGQVESPDGVTVRGEYKVVEEPERLVFSWKWDGQDEETEVTVELKALGEEKTELTLTHSGFATDESSGEHGKGWESTINKLEAFLQNN